jgi:hypothetical protein
VLSLSKLGIGHVKESAIHKTWSCHALSPWPHQGFRGSFRFILFLKNKINLQLPRKPRKHVHVCAGACAHAFFVYGASSQLLCYFILVIKQFLIKLSLSRARALSLSLSLSFTYQPEIPGIPENSRGRQNSLRWTWGRT